MTVANPFSTRFVQPGEIPFRLRDNCVMEDLVGHFLQIPGRIASIVGPHGSGKSTFLETMRAALPDSFKVSLYRLNAEASKRELETKRWQVAAQSWHSETIVLFDGYEQLSWYSSLKLRRLIKSKQSRLLITIHKPITRIPVLWTTQRTNSDDLFVLQFLLRDYLRSPLDSKTKDQSSLHSDDLLDISRFDEAWLHWQKERVRFPSDMRETLMAMYDWWEEKKRPVTFEGYRPF